MNIMICGLMCGHMALGMKIIKSNNVLTALKECTFMRRCNSDRTN